MVRLDVSCPAMSQQLTGVNAEWSLAAAGAPRVVNAEWKSRCLSMEDVHAMLPLYQSETGTVLEPADINPVAVRH